MLENMMTYGYVGLFVIGFGAATILPMSSEAVFAAMIGSGFNPWICVVTASVGNWLGGMTNYYLGYLGKIEWLEKYLKIKRERIVKVQHFVAGKGAMSAFFCFLPAVGDLLAFVLGMMRANLLTVNVSMFCGKLFRYVVLAYGILLGIAWIESW